MASRTDRRGGRTIAAIAVALAVAWALRAATVRPPRPSDLEHVDPAVAALVDERVRAVRLIPIVPSPWLNLGVAYEANGMDDLAAACYARAVRWPWSGARAWYRLAVARHALGNVRGALSAIDRAQAREGAFAPLYWREGLWLLEDARVDEAGAAFDRAIAIDASDHAAWLGRALVMLRRGETEAVVTLLDEWRFRRGPYAPYAHHLLGIACGRRGDLARARIELALASGRPPRWRDRWTDEIATARRGRKARIDAADAMMADGSPRDAVAILEPLAAEAPEDLTVANNLAVALLETGRAADAARRLEAAAAHDPLHAPTFLNLAVARFRTDDHEGALAAAERAAALRPGSTRAHETRGAILTAMRRYSDAAAALDEAVRLDPGNARALRWSGLVHLEMGRPSEGLERLQQAVDRDPGDIEAWIGLAIAHIDAHDGGAAVAALRSAAIIDPAHPRLRAVESELDRLRGSGGP